MGRSSQGISSLEAGGEQQGSPLEGREQTVQAEAKHYQERTTEARKHLTRPALSGNAAGKPADRNMWKSYWAASNWMKETKKDPRNIGSKTWGKRS